MSSDTSHQSQTGQTRADDTYSFEVGVRCRLSELGRARNPKSAAKTGKVLRKARARNQVHLLFDGHATPVTLHRSYVEPIFAENELSPPNP